MQFLKRCRIITQCYITQIKLNLFNRQYTIKWIKFILILIWQYSLLVNSQMQAPVRSVSPIPSSTIGGFPTSQTLRSPPAPGAVTNMASFARRQPSPSVTSVPTNLNYTINRSQGSMAPSNNKLDINLNINVNNDGSISASTGQATPSFNTTNPQFLNSRVQPTVIRSTEVSPFMQMGNTATIMPQRQQLRPQFDFSQLPPGSIPLGEPVPIGGTLGQPFPPPNYGQNMQGLQRIQSIQGIQGQRPILSQSPIKRSPVHSPIKPPSQPLQGQPPILGLGVQPLGIPSGQFAGQQIRPLGLPFGMILPPSYVGYRNLNTNQTNMSGIRPPVHVDTTIESQKVYCVICQQTYNVQQRQSHIKKHQRPHTESDHKIRNIIKQMKQQQRIMQSRPIVQPEQYNIQYNPNQFILEEQNIFTSPQYVPPPQNHPTSNIPAGGETVNYTSQPPQSVRLTNQGEHISYIDPTMYQATRTMKQEIDPRNTITQPPLASDTRFTRNTFVSDEPSPAVQPSVLYNRDTIQSQDYRTSTIPNKLSTASPMTPIIEDVHDSRVQSQQAQTNPIDGSRNTMTNAGSASYNQPTSGSFIQPTSTLPPRDTLASQYRTSQVPVATTTVSDPAIQRATQSQPNNDLSSPLKAPPSPDPNQSIIDSFDYNSNRQSNTQYSGGVIPRELRSTQQPTTTNSINNYQPTSTVQPTNTYNNTPPSYTVQPVVEGRATTTSNIQPDIPIEHIVGEKTGTTPVTQPATNPSTQPVQTQPTNPSYVYQGQNNLSYATPKGDQSITQPYVPQGEQTLDILQSGTATQAPKLSKLPKYAGGW